MQHAIMGGWPLQLEAAGCPALAAGPQQRRSSTAARLGGEAQQRCPKRCPGLSKMVRPSVAVSKDTCCPA